MPGELTRRSFLGLLASTPTLGLGDWEHASNQLPIVCKLAQWLVPFSFSVGPSATAEARILLQRPFSPERLFFSSSCTGIWLDWFGAEGERVPDTSGVPVEWLTAAAPWHQFAAKPSEFLIMRVRNPKPELVRVTGYVLGRTPADA